MAGKRKIVDEDLDWLHKKFQKKVIEPSFVNPEMQKPFLLRNHWPVMAKYKEERIVDAFDWGVAQKLADIDWLHLLLDWNKNQYFGRLTAEGKAELSAFLGWDLTTIDELRLLRKYEGGALCDEADAPDLEVLVNKNMLRLYYKHKDYQMRAIPTPEGEERKDYLEMYESISPELGQVHVFEGILLSLHGEGRISSHNFRKDPLVRDVKLLPHVKRPRSKC